MKFTLFDDDDLKRIEDMMARAMTRAVVSALKIAARDGLMLRPETPATEPEAVQPATSTSPPPLEPVAPAPSKPLPVFLKPPPELPFPPGKATEPPPLNRMAKTRSLYLKLYKTVGDRPDGYVTVADAVHFLGGPTKSGMVSIWLQKHEVEALIVANVRPPTKGLPGKLMINKSSLVARDQLRQANKQVAPGLRRPAPNSDVAELGDARGL